MSYLNNLFSLEGKNILVTGGAKGLGYMMADCLVKAGANVIIASRSEEDCEKAATDLGAFGSCTAISADLSSSEGIAALADGVKSNFSALHVLINNSGRTWGASVDDYPAEQWDKVMELNVKSPFYLMQKLLPLLEAAASDEEPSRVINIGSTAGLDSQFLNAYAYGASKAALLHLTKGLAKELASRNILVNAIAPGYFPSKMTKHIRSDSALEKQALAEVPLGRFGKHEELGALAVYLSSRVSAYITGQTIAIDGGFLVR